VVVAVAVLIAATWLIVRQGRLTPEWGSWATATGMLAIAITLAIRHHLRD
jgi:hypothetical protein